MPKFFIKIIIIITGSFFLAACVTKPRIEFKPAEVGTNCEAGFESKIARLLSQLNNSNTEQYYSDAHAIMLSVAKNYHLSADEEQEIASVLFDNYVHCIEAKKSY